MQRDSTRNLNGAELGNAIVDRTPRFVGAAMHAVPPELDIHLILDKYTPYKTTLLRRWLSKRPHFRLHFTPTGASWINLVERWFATLTEKQVRHGVHRHTRPRSGHHGVHCHNQRAAPSVSLDENSSKGQARQENYLVAARYPATTPCRHLATTALPCRV